MSFSNSVLLCIIITLSLVFNSYGFFHQGENEAIRQLDAFINAPDSSYSFNITSREETESYTHILIRMNSQRYLPDVTDFPLWEHDVSIVIPKNLQNTKRATLVALSGPDNGRERVTEVDERQVYWAQASGTPTAIVYHALNQPMRVKFNGQYTDPLQEDFLVGALWKKYMSEDQDPRFMVHWAMAKAVVRGMDTIQSVLQNDELNLSIEDFVLAGFSKHGWQTYFTAAADERVVGIVPGVIDVLDFKNVIYRIHGALCEFPTALAPYLEFDFADFVGTPEFDSLSSLLDPLSYNRRLRRIPKFLVSATSDQFFLTATENVGYHKLAGVTYLSEQVNGPHGYYDILPQLQTLLFDIELPRLTWFRVELPDGRSILSTNVISPRYSFWNKRQPPESLREPQEVLLWTANNPEERDFRLPTLPSDPQPPSFTPSEPLSPIFSFGRYSSYRSIIPAQSGYTAFVMEFTYTNPINPELPPLKLTTTSFVNPSELPCEDQLPS